MINKNREESWSTWKAKSIVKVCVLIKVNNGFTAIAPFDLTSKNKIKLTTNEGKFAPLPMMPVSVLDKDFRPRPLIRKPINGNNGIK